MKFVVTGDFEVQENQHEAFLVAARTVTSPTLLEDGCETYAFWTDIDRSGHFRVYEEWSTLKQLESHLASPHLAEFRASVGNIPGFRRDINRYEVILLQKQ
jgi:quinol monooxygenase YgiN